MSQQFLSKYFKKSADTNDNPGSAKSPSSSGKNARGKGVAGGTTASNRRQRASAPEETKVSPKTSKPRGRGDGSAAAGKRKAPPPSRASGVQGQKAAKTTPTLGDSDEPGWLCPKCTFQNASTSPAGACAMCGRRQVLPDTATPATTPRGKVLGEEIEISSSDDAGGDDDASVDGNEDDSEDSDFEETAIGTRRKPSGEVAGGRRPTPKRSRKVGASKESPAAAKRRQSPTPRGKPSKPPAACIGNSSAAQGRLRLGGAMGAEEQEELLSEDSDGGAGASDGDGDGDGDGRPGDKEAEASTPFSLSVATKPDGGVSGSKLAITPESFDIQDNTRRRKKFQAGLKAVSPDDTSPSTATGSSSSGGGGGGGGGAGGSGRGLGEANAGGSSSGGGGPAGAGASKDNATAASRRKGRGKAVGAGGVKLTPMEQQVSDLKTQHPGVLLLVECGYRYRFFGEDALAAAKVLRIYAHMDHNFHVASVPTFRLAVHLRRLVDAGYKVGVVRQAESAALKAAGLTETGKKSGTFKRELAAVFSQATWVEGAVEALMPSSSSSSSSTNNGSGPGAGSSGGGGGGGGGGDSKGSSGAGKSTGQGSWRKIGGSWRRVGGWGGGGRGGRGGGRGGGGGGGGASGTEGEGADKEDRGGGSGLNEGEMGDPAPQVDHERSEQWLLSLYEEDASPGASEGEPLSISLALNKGGDDGGDGVAAEVETVRVGLVAVDVRTGKVVHDAFVEGSGQRQELDTRLRHLRPLELLAPGPRLSKATEATLSRYCKSAVDARGDKRVVRTERLSPEEFCFEAAQASLSEYYGKLQGDGGKLKPKGSGRAGKRGEKGGGVGVLTQVLDLARPVVCALGPLMTHLQRFGLDRALASPDLVSFSRSRYMSLDAVTLRDLEVLQCQADGREAGSLFSTLDHTQTAFGRRVLAGWVRQPLLSPEDIRARQDAVEELATDPPAVMERLRPVLRDLKDLDPAIASLHHRRIQPSRLFSLLGTMRKVFAVFHPPLGRAAAGGGGGGGGGGSGSDRRERGEGGGAEAGQRGQQGQARSAVVLEAIAGVPADMAPVIARYLGQLDDEAAAADDFVRALVDGESLCKELAEAGEDEEAANAGMEKELRSVRNTLRKPSLQWKTLRTGATSTVEYLVELRKAEAKKLAPADWMQVSQTKDLARFHTPEVLRLQQDLLRARESRNIAARQAWAKLVSQVDEECYEGFRNAVHALGTLDALLSLAAVAKLPGYVRPTYRIAPDAAGDGGDDGGPGGADGDGTGGEGGSGGGDAIVLRGARHPTVERVLEGAFVPNDVDIRRGEGLVVTGPNMGGKSSTVRMVALICILGQMGSYVPAESAELYCLDGVYTRMGAGDDLAADMSTFMVELWHTSYIIKHATSRSLVVLDELGRGTSTHDGVAIAMATLRHMVRDLGCLTLFVTHYPHVADLAFDKSLSGKVKNAHMSFVEDPPVAAGEEKQEKGGGGGEEESTNEVDGTAAVAEGGSTSAGGRGGGGGGGSSGGGGGGGGKRKRKKEAQGVTFLYRLVVGQAHRSYGLNVARSAGMDEDMLELAAIKSAEMRDRSRKVDRRSTATTPAQREAQQEG